MQHLTSALSLPLPNGYQASAQVFLAVALAGVGDRSRAQKLLAEVSDDDESPAAERNDTNSCVDQDEHDTFCVLLEGGGFHAQALCAEISEARMALTAGLCHH